MGKCQNILTMAKKRFMFTLRCEKNSWEGACMGRPKVVQDTVVSRRILW